MKRLIVVVCTLLISCASAAQERKIPVFLSRTGQDQVGSLFESAFKQELSRSARYEFAPPKRNESGLRFYVEFITADLADDVPKQPERSAVSVVIEDMGLPNSFPVPSLWYHKVIIVDRQAVDKIAKVLLEDLDARWCNHIKNSAGGCPKEKLHPKL